MTKLFPPSSLCVSPGTDKHSRGGAAATADDLGEGVTSTVTLHGLLAREENTHAHACMRAQHTHHVMEAYQCVSDNKRPGKSQAADENR